MENMPLRLFLFYSIPEGIILILFSSVLYGFKLKENLYRIICLGMILAVSSFIIRALPVPIGLNILIEIPLFIILTVLILQISFIRSFFFIITAYIALAIGEVVSYTAISYLSGLTTEQLVDNIQWRMATGWTHLIILCFFIYVFKKKHITFSSTARFFNPKTNRSKISLVLTILVLVQALIAGLLNITIIVATYGTRPVFDNLIFTRQAGVLLFIMSLISGYFIKHIFAASERETVLETYEAFLDNINRLYTTVRGQRHDFINHVHVLYGMLTRSQNEEAVKYITQLLGEIQTVNASIKVKNPVLNALLNTKNAVAESHNITLQAEINTNLEGCKLKPLDVVKVLGNLIDNAIDAVREQPKEFKTVKVKLFQTTGGCFFEVSNPRPIIEPDKLACIFESDYTSKENHTGLGLAVIKNLVQDNRGTISVLSNLKDGTVFTVVIPSL